ncbi:hypothetical protein [Kitasatospora sp. NPDC057223]|uniref:hypothetical protein n=1 Tax=Kitasatospora sp. NPDC057223 TaxID=3346055 RepID=UPI00362FED22
MSARADHAHRWGWAGYRACFDLVLTGGRPAVHYLVTDLLVAAGHTHEQAFAAVARIEWDVLDWAQATVSSTGRRSPGGGSDAYLEGPDRPKGDGV